MKDFVFDNLHHLNSNRNFIETQDFYRMQQSVTTVSHKHKKKTEKKRYQTHYHEFQLQFTFIP